MSFTKNHERLLLRQPADRKIPILIMLKRKNMANLVLCSLNPVTGLELINPLDGLTIFATFNSIKML
jgi:hypothetical protein